MELTSQSGIGAAIGGAIWTNIVPSRISEYMQNEALAAKAYGNPFGFAVEYGLDTLPRQALQRAQDEAQVSLLPGSRSEG